ncbi:Rrf2 family transcriptional regulator, partial [bacterium]
MLWLITTSNPFVPNIEKMSRDLNTSKEYIYHYLEYLESAGLVISLKGSGAGYKLVRKPSKLYIENTNLINGITGDLKINSPLGNIRETFFVNQIKRAGLKINVFPDADFIVDDRIVFEVGGASKNKKQIRNLEQSYLVLENIEVGYKQKIPLYLFGF